MGNPSCLQAMRNCCWANPVPSAVMYAARHHKLRMSTVSIRGLRTRFIGMTTIWTIKPLRCEYGGAFDRVKRQASMLLPDVTAFRACVGRQSSRVAKSLLCTYRLDMFAVYIRIGLTSAEKNAFVEGTCKLARPTRAGTRRVSSA